MADKYFRSHNFDNSLEYIEAVAHTRYGLVIAREAPHTEVTQPECAINTMLLTAVKNVCTCPIINQLDDSTANGPIIFLLKELAKRYGMSFLKQASKRHIWLLPPQLKTTKVCSYTLHCIFCLFTMNEICIQEEASPDMYMVYEASYCRMRNIVADAVYLNKFEELQDVLNVGCLHDVQLTSTCNISTQGSDASDFLNLALHEIVVLGWQRLNQMPKVQYESLVLYICTLTAAKKS